MNMNFLSQVKKMKFFIVDAYPWKAKMNNDFLDIFEANVIFKAILLLEVL